MRLETIFVMLDIAAGLVLLCHAFPAIVSMCRRTRHCIRAIYIALALGAVAMLFSPAMDAEFRRYAHVAVITALAALTLFDRRRDVAHLRAAG